MKTGRCIEPLPGELMEKMAQVLKLLAHPHRLRIVEILQGSEGRPVHDIVMELGLGQAATSQHLTQMRRVGLIASERRGREVWYRIADASSIKILDCIRAKGGKA